MHDEVRLEVPLDARFATTVRSVVASLAATVGMSVDDIEDLRLGVNEAISLLTDVDDIGRDHSGRLHVRFSTEPGRIAIAAHREGVTAPLPEIDVLAQRILTAVVDEYSIGDDGSIRLVKRVPADVGP